MTDNSNNAVHPQQCEPDLAAPRFDVDACAKAQPVVPIPTSRISKLTQSVRSVRRLLDFNSRALALVVIAGLAAGAFGGTILVKQQGPNTNKASFTTSPIIEEIAVGAKGAIEANGPPSSGAGVGTTVKRGSRGRQRRARMPRQPRAYQVDVIR